MPPLLFWNVWNAAGVWFAIGCFIHNKVSLARGDLRDSVRVVESANRRSTNRRRNREGFAEKNATNSGDYISRAGKERGVFVLNETSV